MGTLITFSACLRYTELLNPVIKFLWVPRLHSLLATDTQRGRKLTKTSVCLWRKKNQTAVPGQEIWVMTKMIIQVTSFIWLSINQTAAPGQEISVMTRMIIQVTWFIWLSINQTAVPGQEISVMIKKKTLVKVWDVEPLPFQQLWPFTKLVQYLPNFWGI